MINSLLNRLNKKSFIDLAYRAATNTNKFFNLGIGDLPYLQTLPKIVEDFPAVKKVDIHWKKTKRILGAEVTDGTFKSPMASILPPESRVCHLRMIMPTNVSSSTPVYLHMPGTGDEGFKRREFFLAYPLAKQGIGSILLENPFYGIRRPADQDSMYLLFMSDLFKMVHAAMEEGRSIIDHLTQKYSKVGVTGFSMGGQTATMIALNTPGVFSLIPCITPHSPTPVFIEETLKDAINWEALHRCLLPHNENPIDFLKKYFALSDMTTFPRSYQPKHVEIIAAKQDAYVPKSSTLRLAKALNSEDIHWLKGGHVSTVLLQSEYIRKVLYKLSLKE